MANPKTKRHWNQFSLKTLLVVITVAIVAFGAWVQYRRQRAQENRDRVAVTEEAVTELRELFGKVYFESEERRPQTWLEKQFDDPGDDPVSVVTFLSDLSVNNTTDTDAELEHVIGLLEHVNGLENVEYVFLGNTKITDAGLERLRSLTKLYELVLSDTEVTDAGLEHLKGLSNLQNLYFMDTEVSDAGLEHLKGLTKLRVLRLNNTKVTDEGVKKLKQALPDIQISHYDTYVTDEGVIKFTP